MSMHRLILFVVSICALGLGASSTANAQYYHRHHCWNCVWFPPIVVAPAPVIVAPPPPPPVVVIPAPMVVEPPAGSYWVNGRRCWQQYAGRDSYGQPMWIQACE